MCAALHRCRCFAASLAIEGQNQKSAESLPLPLSRFKKKMASLAFRIAYLGQKLRLNKTSDTIKKMSNVQKVFSLLQRPNHPQRSPAWFQMREGKITASEAACVLPLSYTVCDAFLTEFNLCGVQKGIPVGIKSDFFTGDTDKNPWTNMSKQPFELNAKKWSNPYSSKEEFMIKKCGHSKFTGNIATRHGVKYEQVASDIYARLANTTIHDLSLVEDIKYPWLGASPDGVTSEGKLIEIKVPFRRVPSGIPPFYYWIQMQMQLQCCLELDTCDFIECMISEFKTEDEFTDFQLPPSTFTDPGYQEKGIILEVYKERDYDSHQYIYPPKDMTNPTELIDWADSQITSFYAAQKIQHWWFNTSTVQSRPIGQSSSSQSSSSQSSSSRAHSPTSPIWRIAKKYWKLDKLIITPVQRSEKWFQTVLPILFDAHKEMETYKRTGITQSNPVMSPDLTNSLFHASLYKKYQKMLERQALKSKNMFVKNN